MKRSVACVNSKWRRAVLDAVPSPEDYLASLHENHIPTAIEILGQQKEQKIGLNHIFTLVRQNTSIHSAIRDVRHHECSQSAEQNVVDAPTVANCVRHLHIALDEIENTNGKISVAMQSLARRIILMAHQQQNDKAETEEAEEGQPRRPRQKNIVPLKYIDNANKVRTTIGEDKKVSRCITYKPTPPEEPCTLRKIRTTFVSNPISGDGLYWDEPLDNLPHAVPYSDDDELLLGLIQTEEEIIGIQIKNSNDEHTVNIQFMIPILLESLTGSDRRAIKIVSKQMIGFPSNDYKLNHALTGIGSASAKNPCVCCTKQSKDFHQLCELLYRHRDPTSVPPYKDAPHREGHNSFKASHERIIEQTGGGFLPIPEKRMREITGDNGSCFCPCLIDMPWIKMAHGEALHIANGIINHLNGAILKQS